MIISRQLLHKAQNRLQVILSLVEECENKRAIAKVKELSLLLSQHVETEDEEKWRQLYYE